jgi:hypothetical protein
MFDDLDDPTPIEPSDTRRGAVEQRAAQLRRRRALAPAAVVLLVVALALTVVARDAHGSDQKIVASTGTTTLPGTTPPRPVVGETTVDGVLVQLEMPKAMFYPDEVSQVSLRLHNNGTTPTTGPISVQVCMYEAGSSGAKVGCSDSTSTNHPLGAGETTSISSGLPVPLTAGSYELRTEVNAAPNGPTLHFTVQPDPHAPLTAHIELSSDHVAPGGLIYGDVVVDNPTGHAVSFGSGRCQVVWKVVLTQPGNPSWTTFATSCVPSQTNKLSNQLSVGPGAERLQFAVTAATAPGSYQLQFATSAVLPGFPTVARVNVSVR